MTSSLRSCLLPLLCLQSQSAPASRPDPDRAINDRALRTRYEPVRDQLLKDGKRGKWLAVAGGQVLPWNSEKRCIEPADTLALAVAAADRVAPAAGQRYVFRIGEEGDATWEFGMCDVPHIVGNEFMILTGANWTLGAGQVWVGAGAGARPIGVRGPDARPWIAPEVSAPGSEASTERKFVVATGCGGTVLLPPATARELGLQRFEVPGAVRVGAKDRPPLDTCRRALLRVRLPALGFDALVPVAIWSNDW